jgi:hypothetical protein
LLKLRPPDDACWSGHRVGALSLFRVVIPEVVMSVVEDSRLHRVELFTVTCPSINYPSAAGARCLERLSFF